MGKKGEGEGTEEEGGAAGERGRQRGTERIWSLLIYLTKPQSRSPSSSGEVLLKNYFSFNGLFS